MLFATYRSHYPFRDDMWEGLHDDGTEDPKPQIKENAF
jgi:hypothetical protein